MLAQNEWRPKLLAFTHKSNAIGLRQILLTIIPIILIWVAYAQLVERSTLWVLPFSLLVSLFIVRCFVLMHDCGHYAMFSSKRLNEVFGFMLGVITGMPQFVWSKNHTYHHNTNGDWVKYGGVFNIVSTETFAKMTKSQQRRYWLFRQPLILIPAGFFYVVFFPRINWILGNLTMLWKIMSHAFHPSEAVAIAKKWETKYWKGKKDYRHMTYNNVALLLIWFVMCKMMGPTEFFMMYVISTSLAGSIGILIFTIQHNFEDAYATDTAQVDHFRAAVEGTSMLVLPKILNWFTADIAYHHLHHLSIAIPNYRLAACHRELESMFTDVRRFGWRDLLSTFNYQLWDPSTQKVVARNRAN